ncbi:MAG: hypothetical protein WCW13_05755 [archaeon]|jgi:hypothetical protein
MPYKPKGRIEILNRLNAKRAEVRLPGHNSPAILLGSSGGITRKKVSQVLARWHTRKVRQGGAPHFTTTASNESILTIKKGGLKLSSMYAVARLSRRYLMKSLSSMRLKQEQKQLISRIILSRPPQKIPHTKIGLRPPVNFLLIGLANSFEKEGYAQVARIFRKLSDRAKTLQTIYQKGEMKTDAFTNVYLALDANASLLELIEPEEMARDVAKDIAKRREEMNQLKEMNTPEGRRYAEMLRIELLRAEMNNAFFKANNHLPHR